MEVITIDRKSYCTNTVALQKLMIERGIKTRTELAQKCKIDRNTLGKIVNGKEQPSSAVMYKLAEGLDMTSTQAGLIFFSTDLLNA